MLPLLDLRNDLDLRGEHEAPLRDFRRLNGRVDLRLKKDGTEQHVRGPYTQAARESWLRRVLQAQCHVREAGPEDVHDLELISLPELEEIRRIWLTEKNELEDHLPAIYEEVIGTAYPSNAPPPSPFGPKEMRVLADVCSDDRMQYEAIRDLLSVEQRYRNMLRRSGQVFVELEETIARTFYEDESDALAFARSNRTFLSELRETHGVLQEALSDDPDQLYLGLLPDEQKPPPMKD